MIEILKESIESSTGDFSTPNEIKRHLEDLTGEQITTNRLSALLKELGFLHSRAYQRVSKNGIKSSFYHLKEDKKLRLHLKNSSLLDGIDPVQTETLTQINYRFLKARSEKEGSLASLRKIESEIAHLRKEKTQLENQIQSGAYIKTSIAQQELDVALVEFKSELDLFSFNLAPQLASLTDENEVSKILEGEVNRVLTKLSKLDVSNLP